MTYDVDRSKPIRVPIRFIYDDEEEGDPDVKDFRPRDEANEPRHDRRRPSHERGEREFLPAESDLDATDPFGADAEEDVFASEEGGLDEGAPLPRPGGVRESSTPVATGWEEGGEESPAAVTGSPRATGRASATPDELDSLRRQLEESVAREKRWLADLDNYRRRTERVFEEQAETRKRALAFDLLDVLDDLDRALAHAGENEGGLGQGVEAIRDKFLSVLGRHGIKPFNPVNEPFDPTRQEAVSVIRHPELENNTVARVLRPGWKAGDKLLRPAHVVVVKND